MLNKPECDLYFISLKVATLCFDDSFSHFWHSVSQIKEVVIWNGFQLTGAPCLELISFPLNVFETITYVVQS